MVEYELMRARNIESNTQLIKSIGIEVIRYIMVCASILLAAKDSEVASEVAQVTSHL